MTLQKLAQVFISYRDKGQKIPPEVWPQTKEFANNLPSKNVRTMYPCQAEDEKTPVYDVNCKLHFY